MQEKMTAKHYVWILIGLLVCVGLWWFADSQYLVQMGDYVTKNLNAMRENVLKLTAISTMSSTMLTLLPGDVATPLAENLADISDYLIFVFIGLWLQKYLFFSLSGIALKVLVPVGIVLTVFPQVLTWFNLSTSNIQRIRKIGTRVASFGTVIFLVVPITLALTKQIEGNYQDTIDRTVQQSEQVQASVDKDTKEEAKKAAQKDQAKKEEKPKDLLGQVSKMVTDSVDGVVDTTNDVVKAASDTVGQLSGSVTELPNQMMKTLDNLIESLALMIVVNCVAPIFIFIFLMRLVRMLFGLSLQPIQGKAPFRPMGNAVRKYKKAQIQEFVK